MTVNPIAESTPLCRVIVEPCPQRGSWNMAVDETLLESALAGSTSTLRLYRWAEPTVSLGHFQKNARLEVPERLAGLPSVRRLSGGGAILHHLESTYSFSLVPGHPLIQVPSSLYDTVHSAIIEVLEAHGVPAELRGQALQQEQEPFLCFGRGDPRDVVLAGHKILGSAQRRRRGAVLQHGSLLLQQSPFTPEFPGIQELAPGSTLGPSFESEIVASILARVRDVAPAARIDETAELTADEVQRARELETQRYQTVE